MTKSQKCILFQPVIDFPWFSEIPTHIFELPKRCKFSALICPCCTGQMCRISRRGRRSWELRGGPGCRRFHVLGLPAELVPGSGCSENDLERGQSRTRRCRPRHRPFGGHKPTPPSAPRNRRCQPDPLFPGNRFPSHFQYFIEMSMYCTINI